MIQGKGYQVGRNEAANLYLDQDYDALGQLQEEDHTGDILPKMTTVIISAAVVVLYFVFWLIQWIFPSSLWNWSVRSSESWSQVGGYWSFHFWVFSDPFWVWWPALFGILLIVTPRRASSLKSIATFFISSWTSFHFRIWGGSSRPNWVSKSIVMRESCKCCYGLPGNQAEIGFLLWAILVYELIAHAKHITRTGKLIWIGAATFIVLNITLAPIFYGQNGIWQTFLGLLHGACWFCLMLIFSQPLTNLFRDVINGVRKQQFVVLGVAAIMFLFNLVMWYSFEDDEIAEHAIVAVRCESCFASRNYSLRRQSARSVAFTHTFLGMIVGLILVNPKYYGLNDFMVNNHLSITGIKRIVIMAAMHLPLLLLLIRFSPGTTFWFDSIVYFIVGIMVTYVDIVLNNKLQLNFKGDIYPANVAPTVGYEADPLLGKEGKDAHFNPYNKTAASAQYGSQLGSHFGVGPSGTVTNIPQRRPPE